MTDTVEPKQHSPGRILAALLIDLNVGDMPPAATGRWAVFYEHLPDYKDAPTNILACTTTTPVSDGTVMVTGRSVLKHGVQIRIRANSDAVGFAKAASIIETLNRSPVTGIDIDGITYKVHRAKLSSGPQRLGRSKENRFEYTVNVTVSITTLFEDI